MSVLAPPRSPPLTRHLPGRTACASRFPLLPLACVCGLLFFVGLSTGPFYRIGMRCALKNLPPKGGVWGAGKGKLEAMVPLSRPPA